MQNLVAGIDSSTQSCKVMIRDAETGQLVRSGVARHRTGTEVHPDIWWRALQEAINQAGGIEDVSALAVGGQQHGMVALDEDGDVIRNAILWNDTRSGRQAEDLISELGNGDAEAGKAEWARRVGLVPVASFTATKIRWLAEAEEDNFKRVAAIALPHDWLTWKLRGSTDISELVTDRSDASGTGYFDPVSNEYQRDLLALIAPGAENFVFPTIKDSSEIVGEARGLGSSAVIAPGMGDNAGAALGLAVEPGQLIMSIGTSGVVTQVVENQIADPSGLVAGFADATGKFLPLVATLNASRVLNAYASLLEVDHRELSKLALNATPGAEGLVVVPYMEGERTPNLPNATGSLMGIRLENLTRENVARAAVEGMLCGVGEGIEALKSLGANPESVTLIGGGAQSEAVRKLAPTVFGMPVHVPEHGEYVADGAARQAAWALSEKADPPEWLPRLQSEYIQKPRPEIRQQYNLAKQHFVSKDDAIAQ